MDSRPAAARSQRLKAAARPTTVAEATTRGFTLIEVLVALTMGAFVVLAAHQTFAGATDASLRLGEARERHELEMRARQVLTATLANLDVASPGVVGFRGAGATVAFSTLDEQLVELRVADGWLTLRHGANAADSQRPAVNALRLLAAEAVTFDYLLHAGANEAWVREWHSPVSAPLAVRVRLTRPDGLLDTLLFAIGSRG